jgi:hypothetical protein
MKLSPKWVRALTVLCIFVGLYGSFVLVSCEKAYSSDPEVNPINSEKQDIESLPIIDLDSIDFWYPTDEIVYLVDMSDTYFEFRYIPEPIGEDQGKEKLLL